MVRPFASSAITTHPFYDPMTQLTATTSTISWTLHPRERSNAGFFNPCTIGPRAICSTHTLRHFITDVAGIEIRENKDVSFAGNWTCRCLSLRNFRNNGSVELKLAVDLQIAALSSLTISVACTTLSTDSCFALPFVEKESMATRGSSPTSFPVILRSDDRDVGKLLHGRIWNNAAIGKRIYLIWKNNQEEAGYDGYSISAFR